MLIMTAFGTSFFLILLSYWNASTLKVSATSCQVYPSDYAYHGDYVYRTERSSANCSKYPLTTVHSGGFPQDYTHCDGTQLRLTDSDPGSEVYNSSEYYEWIAGSSRQLLFIFPTRVNLTTITLHYYSSFARGLPRLIFYAVPDDFDVWVAPHVNYSRVDVTAVPPGGEPAGRRNVSINVNFSTKKMLLYKDRNKFTFVVSEVEFSTCNAGTETIHSSSTMLQTTTTQSYTGAPTKEQFTTDTRPTVSITTITLTEKSTANSDTKANSHTASTDIRLVGIGIAVAIVILLLLSAIAVVALVIFLRNSAQRKADYDDSYSTLCRESVPQMQPQSLHTTNDLYDQIQLSPSTGQAEFISTIETANTNNPLPHQNEYGIHPSVDKDKPKSAKLKIAVSTISSQDEDKSTSEKPTYAVVNKKKKQKTEKESVLCPSQNTADQNLDVREQNVVEERNQPQQSQDGQETATQIPSHTVEPMQDLYTAVKKKPKHRPANDEEKAPPIPPHTVEELYTVVQKKPKASTEENNNDTPVLPHTMEELYTAVKKKPKGSTEEDEEEALPIPTHTVEELYSAVQKRPKANTAVNEEESTPVPPHTLD